MSTKLSENFTLEEFQEKGFPLVPKPKEVFMLRSLVFMLQIIRSKFGLPIRTRSCYRDMHKTADLQRQGLHPSETSDHYFGQPIQLLSMDKIKQYGPVFDLSVGAVDFYIPGIDLLNAFEEMVKMAKGGLFVPGQLIYEENKLTYTCWIHLSNPRSLLYSQPACLCLFPARETFLTSFDGGASYHRYSA